MADVVTVKVHSARSLAVKAESLDGFVQVWTSNKKKHKKTKAASKSTTPTWNETIYLPLDVMDPNACIRFEVCNRTFLSRRVKPAFLGQCSIAIRDILPELIESPVGSSTKWLTLLQRSDKKAKVSGELNVTIIFPKPVTMQFATDHFPAMIKQEEKEIEYSVADNVDLSKLPAAERHRLEVLREFYQTETRYVNDLKLLKTSFKNPLVEQHILTKSEADQIFLNIDEIYELNRIFAEELTARKNENSFIINLSDLVLEHSQKMAPYSSYCSSQAAAVATLEKFKKEKSQLRQFLEQDLPSWRGLQLEDYLVKPFQRITRYPLLVREIIKVTPTSTTQYSELKEASKNFEELMKETNELVRDASDKQMNKQIWGLIDDSPICSSFIKSNLQIISSLAEAPDVMNSFSKAPRVKGHFPITYRKDGGVPHHGHCVLFENCIFLVHGKIGQFHPLDLIPLLSLHIINEDGTNLIAAKETTETEEQKQAKAAAHIHENVQDDKELSYLVQKFVRFERLFQDNIIQGQQLLAPLLNNEKTREDAFPLVATLAGLTKHFSTTLDKVEELLLSTTPDTIRWLDIYYIFMELMPHFEELAHRLIDGLPLFYKQSIFCEEFTEFSFVRLMQLLFALVDHTPAYVRSAHRILQRIPDDPNLPSLLGTFRMIEASVKAMGKLRRRFDSRLELLAVTSRISSVNLYEENRALVYHNHMQDITTHENTICFLFNDLLITCITETEGTYTMKCSVSMVSKPKRTLSVLQMSPTTLQVLISETGENLVMLKTTTEADCATWISHIQSVIDDNAVGSTSKTDRGKKTQLIITGSSSVAWSLCLNDETEAQLTLMKILPVYQSYLSSILTSFAQDQLHQMDSEDKKKIPSSSVKGITAGSEAHQLLKDLHSVAVAEYLMTKHSPEELASTKQSIERYSELLTTLQQTCLHKYDGASTNLYDSVDTRTRSGTSTFNTIRKALRKV